MKTIIKSFFSISLLLITAIVAQIYGQGIDPKLTEVWEPVPAVITPGTGTEPSSDAIVLFNGDNLNEWMNKDGDAAEWTVKGDAVTVKRGKGVIKTKRTFGDIQLHIEWRTPAKVKGDGQGRGNSGIFLMERYELQVLDSYDNITYPNGQAGGIYKQGIPLVNACRPPGEWQTYDVIFMAPVFTEKGTLKSPARITVFQNGVLVQNNFSILGPTVYTGIPRYQPHGKASLVLQDHGNPVSYRNIWVREL